MTLILEFIPLIIYLLLYTGLKVSEHLVLTRRGTHIRKGWRDWSVWLMILPLWLAFIGPIVEFVIFNARPDLWEVILGSLLLIGAGVFSVKGYADLQRGFADAIELDQAGLVVKGLYDSIRHPVTLGNILFCVGCPVLLAAGPSWIPALMGVLGMLLRISVEEAFMGKHITDYAAYKERTWALVPYIY